MNWKKLFVPGNDLSVVEAQEFMADKGAEEYQLLDVRQPSEYEAAHLAGAVLIPLKELPDRLGELDKEKPLIVYCAIGGRSKMAAQFLAGYGFLNVYNMAGGIKAWQGNKATGPEMAGLELFAGDQEFVDGLSLAYSMEDGLQDFYKTLAANAEEVEDQVLFTQLMGFEDKHKLRLASEYQRIHGQDAFPPQRANGLMEGGGRAQDLLTRVEGRLHGKKDILEFAMALETQALDLYTRMARKALLEDVRNFFLSMANEEKRHLSLLSDELDKVLLAQG